MLNAGGAGGEGPRADTGHGLSTADNHGEGLVEAETPGRELPLPTGNTPHYAGRHTQPCWKTLSFKTNPKMSLIRPWLLCPRWR